MNTEIYGILAAFLATVLLAYPLGIYISKVFKGEKSLLDFIAPIEKFIYKICGIDPTKSMSWKQHLVALLTLNIVWFIYAIFVLINQGELFLNPDGNPSMAPDLGFNTAISFLVNCNLQHYSGETGVTYLTQLAVITFLQFVSAATGIAALIVVFNSLQENFSKGLGNFYEIFLKSITRILLPLCIILAGILAFNGTPSSYEGKDTIVTLAGDTVQVARGPAAGMIAIKHLGTNGGGWFGANSAHPLENPNYFTNLMEIIAQMLIPVALIFSFGFYINRKKFSWVIFGVMTLGTLCFLIPAIVSEIQGNPMLAQMGIPQTMGNMEGKEVRFGAAASAYWSIITTVISTGSVNAMHDSMMPVSSTVQLLAMMTNTFYGGCGVGILNYYIYIILAVFISGLMVGRTPEFMGRKIEAREVKIATLIALLHPFLILSATAIASFDLVNNNITGWLNNSGYHGFSEMLYEYTSSAANNGSGFEGLGDNTLFWNISTGFVLILGRFLPIIGPVAIAGILYSKKRIPESAGTLKTDTFTFGIMTFAVIMIIAALAFFPALVLGPFAEYFTSIPH